MSDQTPTSPQPPEADPAQLSHQAGPGVPAYQAHPQPYASQPPTRTTSGLAIASLVLGIVWLGWVGSILAVIFGHIALGQTKQPGVEGRGLAVAGLVLGYVGVATLALWFIPLTIGAISAAVS